MLNGDFREAVQFLCTFKEKIDKEKMKQMTLTILKQNLYELLENPDENQLKDLFEKQIIGLCDQGEYQHLFTLLTCKSAQEIPGMANWTKMQGRYHCFETVLPELERMFQPAIIKNKQCPFTLEEAVNNMMRSLSDDQNILESVRQDGSSLPGRQGGKHHPVKQGTSNGIHDTCEGQINPNRVQKSMAFLEKSHPPEENMHFKPPQKQTEDRSLPKPKSKQMGISKLIRESHLLDAKAKESNEPERQEPLSHGQDFEVNSQHHEQSMLQEEVRRNIAYLDPSNASELREEENFTFSNGAEESFCNFKQVKFNKLATVEDPKAIRTCQFSVSGAFFALGTNSSFLKIYDVSDLFEENIASFLVPRLEISQLHSKSIFSLDWSLNEKAIVTCSNDLTIKVTEFREPFEFESYKTTVIGRHESCIRMVKFNSLQTKIVSCGDDSLIKLWDIEKVKRCVSLKGHEQGVNAFKFSEGEDSTTLYSVSKDCTIRRWDMRVGSAVALSSPCESQMTFIANNTQSIVVSHKNGCVTFFDEELRDIHNFKLHEQEIRSIDGTNYEDLLLTSSFDGNVCMFQPKFVENAQYHPHNEFSDDKVVFATFLNHPEHKGFASTSTLGLCNLYSYE